MKRFTVLLSVKIVVSIVVLSISIGGGDAHHELCSTNADGVDNHHQQVEPICELDVVTTVDEQKVRIIEQHSTRVQHKNVLLSHFPLPVATL